jgi:hypothetical protein
MSGLMPSVLTLISKKLLTRALTSRGIRLPYEYEVLHREGAITANSLCRGLYRRGKEIIV